MLQHFAFNLLETNCYVLYDETHEAVIVDCGATSEREVEPLFHFISEHGLTPVRVLHTHGHFDHIWGDNLLYDRYGLKPEVHTDDAELYRHFSEQLYQFLHLKRDIVPIDLQAVFSDGCIISFGQTQLRVIHTPGHTPGGVCLYDESNGVLLSGDTLFFESVGNTTFPGGDAEALQQSIVNKLLILPPSVMVYPGHGPHTTIGHEQSFF